STGPQIAKFQPTNCCGRNSTPFYNRFLVVHLGAVSRSRGHLASRGRTVPVLFRRVAASAAVGIVVGLIATQAWSQEPPPSGTTAPPPSGTTAQPPPPLSQAPPTVPIPAAPIATYPLELLGLLAPPAQRGPLTLFPSIGVSEEYNDNVHGDNRHRESDFITNFSPTITLQVNRPSYNLNAGYSFSAALYAEGTQPNEAFQSQNFIGSG